MGKKKNLIYGSFGFCLLQAGQLFAADPSTYLVKEGDYFSKIVEDFAVKSKEYNFHETYNLFLRSNRDVANIDILLPNDKISIPVELRIINPEKGHIHVVEKGDTLFEIMQVMYPGENPEKNVGMVLSANPDISDIDLIEVGQEIILPNRKPAGAMPQDVYAFVIEDKESLSDEIVGLSKTVSRYYIGLFKRLNASKKKLTFLAELKNIMEFSRVLKHGQLEHVFLKLIDSTLKSSSREHYISDLKTFYQIWKEARERV